MLDHLFLMDTETPIQNGKGVGDEVSEAIGHAVLTVYTGTVCGRTCTHPLTMTSHYQNIYT